MAAECLSGVRHSSGHFAYIIHLSPVPISFLQGTYYPPHFTNEEIKAERISILTSAFQPMLLWV